MTDYGFTVQQMRDWNDPTYEAAVAAFTASRTDGPFGWMQDPDRPIPPTVDQWNVYLPHQCDEWQITDDRYSGVGHDEAVAALQEFILQARAALVALQVRQEMDE